jgi:hypothetical protein
MLNYTRIPAPRVSIVDPQTGIVSNEWFRFFNNLYTIAYSGTNVTTAGTYGSATAVSQITINEFGGITGLTNVPIAIDANQIVSGTLPIVRGGTGLGTLPSDGQLLIGDVANGYVLNTLTPASGIGITNAPGAITVANTGVLSNIAGSGVSVSGATGNVTIANTGVLSFSAGTTGLTPSTATTGAITLAGTLAVANGGTGVTTSTGSGNNVLATRPTMSVTGAGFTLQDATDNTKQANFVLSSIPTATTYAYTLPNVTGTLAALNLAQTFTATQTFSGVTVSLGGVTTLGGAVTMNTIAGAINIGSGQTTGTTTVGNTAQTGTITLGQSTVSQTTNIQAGATASGSTKAINIGTNGVAGSTTNTTIGSTAGTSTTTINSLLVQQTYLVANLPAGVAGARSFVTNALAPAFGAAVAGGGAVGVPVYHDGTSWKVG